MPPAGPSRQARYSPQSLHFPLPELPTPTPPSLLKRSGSASSSSAAYDRRGTTTATTSAMTGGASTSTHYRGATGPSSPSAYGGIRRESAGSTSSSSFSSRSSFSSGSDSADPVTPELRHQLEHDIEIVHDGNESTGTLGSFDLDARPYQAKRPVLSKQSFSALSAAYYQASEHASTSPRSAETPSRPRLIRRGTPRPAESLSALSISPADGADRRYISMIDGGAWIIRERR